jgi:hypothetical protein
MTAANTVTKVSIKATVDFTAEPAASDGQRPWRRASSWRISPASAAVLFKGKKGKMEALIQRFFS